MVCDHRLQSCACNWKLSKSKIWSTPSLKERKNPNLYLKLALPTFTLRLYKSVIPKKAKLNTLRSIITSVLSTEARSKEVVWCTTQSFQEAAVLLLWTIKLKLCSKYLVNREFPVWENTSEDWLEPWITKRKRYKIRFKLNKLTVCKKVVKLLVHSVSLFTTDLRSSQDLRPLKWMFSTASRGSNLLRWTRKELRLKL